MTGRGHSLSAIPSFMKSACIANVSTAAMAIHTIQEGKYDPRRSNSGDREQPVENAMAATISGFINFLWRGLYGNTDDVLITGYFLSHEWLRALLSGRRGQ